jgi:hypothetical protein
MTAAGRAQSGELPINMPVARFRRPILTENEIDFRFQ